MGFLLHRSSSAGWVGGVGVVEGVFKVGGVLVLEPYNEPLVGVAMAGVLVPLFVGQRLVPVIAAVPVIAGVADVVMGVALDAGVLVDPVTGTAAVPVLAAGEGDPAG